MGDERDDQPAGYQTEPVLLRVRIYPTLRPHDIDTDPESMGSMPERVHPFISRGSKHQLGIPTG